MSPCQPAELFKETNHILAQEPGATSPSKYFKSLFPRTLLLHSVPECNSHMSYMGLQCPPFLGSPRGESLCLWTCPHNHPEGLDHSWLDEINIQSCKFALLRMWNILRGFVQREKIKKKKFHATEVAAHSRRWFQSVPLWLGGPAIFCCATLLPLSLVQ